LLAFLAVLLAVLLAYLQTLGGPLLWDDRFLILGAGEAEQHKSLAEFLRAPFWQGEGQATNTSYYRPLVKLSFALDARVHGANAGGYHLTNVVLHTLNAWLVLLLLLRRGGVRRGTAALLAIAWALLPRLAEAAAWISGRTDLLATAFTLGALLAWERALGRRLLAAGLVLLGLLAKESAAAGLCALALAEATRLAREDGKLRWGRLAKLLAPLALTGAAYLALRLGAVGLPPPAVKLGAVGRLATFLESLGSYAAMLLDVYRPRAVIGRVGAWSPEGVAAGAAVLFGGGFLVQRWRGRLTPNGALALGLGVGALLPVLHLFPLPLRTLVADRFLYLPAAALALGFGPAVDRRLGVKRGYWLASIALVASLGYATYRRAALWSDETAFWVETYLETPRLNNAAVTELVGVYYRAALWEDALALSERGLDYDDPNRAALRYDKAICLSRLGRLSEARGVLEQLSSRRPDPEAELALGLVELRSGDFAAAERRFAGLARRGAPQARLILARFPEFVAAQRELAALPEDADPAESARLASLLGDDARATAAWSAVARQPTVSKAALRSALEYLLRGGNLPTLRAVARAYMTRFGEIEPGLATLLELRLSELGRLVEERTRLGLPTPAAERAAE
jgi:protein O-mannosyl-transferase